MNAINLNNCKPGQKLKSKHGMILTYIGPTGEGDYYDHYVKYPNGSMGTRCNDGFVFRNPGSRLPEDHDIVEILDMKYHLTFRPDNTESQSVTVAGSDFQEMMAAFLREMLKIYGNCFLFAPMFEAMKEISDANDNGESKFDFNYCEFSDPESHFALTFEVK